MLLKHFVSLTIFRKKSGSVLRCRFQWLCLCIFYQVKELITCKYSIERLWETSKKTFLLKLRSSNVLFSAFFLEICRSFRRTSEKLALENFIIAYHTNDRITPMFCKLSCLVFLCVFCVIYKSKSWRYNGSLGKEVGYSLIYLPEC